ncbi:hypothetical protein CXB51_004583 [Gossypium anomalum]|uniref:hydroxyacylglutathione hydrolase n=1 Tax=Gossypium anomalum TaxID=47600 RepID=A0A8J6D806_9ROSI|nr:hypothetical protein CXB51_004583 [Gossypium anomalum]
MLRRQLLVSHKEAAVVDPVEAEKVFDVANQHGVVLKFVLTTHHHWDHAGGNDKIKQLVPGIKVYGGSLDNVRGCTHQLQNGDTLSLGSHLNILALHTPCHTKGHISYYITGKDGEDPAVFTGDTLFYLHGTFEFRPNCWDLTLLTLSFRHKTLALTKRLFDGLEFIAGCGKFFEGTAEQMYQSLCVTLGSLPKPTRVYCGHEVQRFTVPHLLSVSVVYAELFEIFTMYACQHPVSTKYTVKNLQFASTVEPKNARIQQKLAWANGQRKAGLPTIPSTIEEEMETNPFMRVDLPELQGSIGCQSPVEALREIRQMKDNWRG